MDVVNALSVDLEDWFHPELVRNQVGDGLVRPWIAESTEPILHLLERYGVRATFFVVGEVMRQHPRIVRRIHAQGHEIACHGMSHRPLWELTPAALEQELAAFRELSVQVLGTDAEIRGFRAPTFSLDHRTRWAVPILARWGFVYDASVFPFQAGLYGQPGAPVSIYRLAVGGSVEEDPEASILEFPPATWEVLGQRLPVGGGFYLRLLPVRLLRCVLKRINRARPFLIYVHPWETDRATPRLDLSLWGRLVTYHGVGSALRKLEVLLETFRFATVWESLGTWCAAAGPVTGPATGPPASLRHIPGACM